ncbi:MAG: T9SS type A sorting domain-containing protein [candidate division WOR-3 bacterium]|nr:T9SS type A sorting domain-containing protein [candidate division WOR-3 bacterium]MDW8149855.1 T9SS type A sorting domain-containing protein [candidate division WOR-3 bacterium]
MLLLLYFNSFISERCLTPQVLESFQKGEYKTFSRPTLSGPEQIIQTQNFVIHYTTSGTDAVSPAYAESVAVFAEYSWNILVNQIGWFAPPPDNNQGGNNKYDIYIKNIGAGVLGYAVPESPYYGYGTEGYTSYFVINKNIDAAYGIGVLKVTVAHEFHHAVQFAYTALDGGWFYENTATWIEDIVYDNVNDYISYLGVSGQSPLTAPQYRINTFQNGGLYQYAGAIFPYFIYEYLGNNHQALKDIWHRMGTVPGNNTLIDIFDVLSGNYSKSQEEILSYYAIWRFFTGNRWNDGIGYRYSEGNLYPTSTLFRNISTYPSVDSNQTLSIQNPGGAQFIRLSPYSGALRIVIKFKQCQGCANVYLIRIPGPVIDNITGNGDSINVIYDFSGYSYASIVIVSKTLGGNDIVYRYRIEPASNVLESRYSEYKILVNGRNVEIITDKKDFDFRLFSIDGKAVSNRNLAKGVYFYQLKMDKKTYKGKIIIN